MSGWFSPTSYVPSISQIAFDDLRADGVRGLIVDLDNTLVGYRALEPEERDAVWVAQALESGFSVVMLTNNATPWANDMARRLNVPIISNARKPLPGGFRRALALLDMPTDEVTVIGDQIFTDVLGSKLLGLRVILVGPLVRRDPWNTFPLRLLERLLESMRPRTPKA